jgi:hypothetical protein
LFGGVQRHAAFFISPPHARKETGNCAKRFGIARVFRQRIDKRAEFTA